MQRCAYGLDVRCAYCAVCRDALRPAGAAAAFDMPTTVSCAAKKTKERGRAQPEALSHALLCCRVCCCACVRNSASALAAADRRRSPSSLVTRHAAPVALLRSITFLRTHPLQPLPLLCRPLPRCPTTTRTRTATCRPSSVG
jgi:hypothetical protein